MTREHPAHDPVPARTAKTALRDQVLAARRRRPLLESSEEARAVAHHLGTAPEVRRAATVAAYVSVGREPGTGLLLDALVASGKRVLLPVLLPDDDLDWASWSGGDLVPAGRGLLEPASPRLGVDAVVGADVVLLPGLAVSADGMRLGRGGGSYDRVLARLPASTFTCVLLHTDELDRPVPAEAHDRAVRAAVTADGLVRFSRRE